MKYYLTKKPAIQLTGVTCGWRRAAKKEVEIVRLEVNGKPVDDNQRYTCATSDFFAGQAKGYIGMEIDRPVFLQKTVFEVAENAARKAKTVYSPVEHRIKEVH